MIPLNFYRDDEYVYYNNPNGITKKMTIADFETVFNVDTSELPTYTSSDGGKVLTVNSGGTGLEWGEISGGGNTSLVLLVTYTGEETTVQAGETFSFFDVEYNDTATWEVVDISTLEFDYCVPISITPPQSTDLIAFAFPDNDASFNFSLTVRNVSNGSITISTNKEVAYIKLINPRPISTPSEPGE